MFAKKKNLTVFRFPGLSKFPELSHGVFARPGGLSRAPFSGLNVGLSVGDDPGRVLKNRGAIQECLGMTDSFYLQQTHGTEICWMDAPAKDSAAPVSADAVVTRMENVALVIQVADCQPVMLYDFKARVIANIHSGWRGSIQNIIGKTVRFMERSCGCRAENMVAAIGPSLGPCCAEFVHYKKEFPEPFWKYGDSRNYFDFWRISRDQLTDAGVPGENIETAGLCTRCRSDLFFSYRKEKKTGRFAAVIALKGGERNKEKS